jgi:hypothetical protein
MDKLLSLKKSDLLGDTNATETGVDRLAYELHGLTEDEIRIVEGVI